ncbi:GL16757 [Drosophila persimilis]|uniref:GL16757 n=1 Tax=Drosophila persimilis TaxID=7234 RepID=B4GIH1_DROPE|nr:GL16757 [Drosophila persimilis]
MTNFIAKKSLLVLSLLLLGTVQAQPLEDHHGREQRQLKGGPGANTDADVKMVANVTPAEATSMQMGMGMSLPMNQMALNAVGTQLVRYPNYPGLIYAPGIAQGSLNGLSGLQTNIANNYPAYPDPNMVGASPGFGAASSFGGAPGFGGTPSFGAAPGFGTGPGFSAAPGFGPAPGFGTAPGFGFGSYPGASSPAALMYGNPMSYPNPQLPNGFVPQPSVDNFSALNNIVNMANVQGLGGSNQGFYQNPQLPGLYAPAGGYMERMNMQGYAPAF